MASLTLIQELLTKHSIVDPLIVKDFLGLAGSRSAAQNRPANIIKDGTEYFYCRNSSHYFLLENMVKDKNGKSKGYSSIGNSIYTQAQNHKKGLLKKIDLVKDEIIGLDMKSKTYKKDRDVLMTDLSKFNSTIEDGKYADGLWMVESFLGSLKPERQELFKSIAFTKDALEAEEAEPKK